jgi:GxxExxY protein
MVLRIARRTAFTINQEMQDIKESVVKNCLATDLTRNGLIANTEVPLPISTASYGTVTVRRADLVVNNALVVELKANKKITTENKKQLIKYCRIMQLPGLLLNFHNESLEVTAMMLVDPNSGELTNLS